MGSARSGLRSTVDLLGLEIVGHVSVEKVDKRAQRVVESHFPETLVVSDVASVTQAMVLWKALRPWMPRTGTHVL